MTLIWHNLEETKAFANQLAALIKGKNICLSLAGDLGAGKTTFTQFLGKALGVTQAITSPTFTIMKSYRMADGRPLTHIDAYRLEGISQDLGFEESFDEGVTVIEWAQFLETGLPEDRINLTIELVDETRQVSLSAIGKNAEEVLAQL